MKIGIIGSGNVGGALGIRWARGGHTVVFGSRSPEKDQQRQLVAEAGRTARSATLAEAIAASDVVLLATPWPATLALVESLDFSGKVLIDATNPLLPDLSGIEYGTTTSGGEQVAARARGARVVKAFNTVGNNLMVDATFADGKPVLFYCGDDSAAKQQVRGLAAQLGFDAQDAGPLTQARVLEPFAMLWISLAVFQGFGREFAFKLMRR